MCSLCGTLDGGRHWSDSQANPEAFAARAQTHTWRRERQERTRLLNRILAPFALSVTDWEGNAYVLRTRTGRTEIVNNLGACDIEKTCIAPFAIGPCQAKRDFSNQTSLR